MATITITVPDGLREKVETAWPGTTLEEHVQARLDPVFARWETEAPAVVKKARLDKYERLEPTDQAKVDALLAKAPEPVEEEEEIKLPAK